MGKLLIVLLVIGGFGYILFRPVSVPCRWETENPKKCPKVALSRPWLIVKMFEISGAKLY